MIGAYAKGTDGKQQAASCGADLHDALHVAPDFSGVEVALGVAHHVQPLNGVLTSVLRQILVRLVGLNLLSCITQQTQFSQQTWVNSCEACWAALAQLHDTANAVQIDYEKLISTEIYHL